MVIQLMLKLVKTFQSTLSVRRATVGIKWGYQMYIISIHALREESDTTLYKGGNKFWISIHALREESDQLSTNIRHLSCGFQSTLSVRRATVMMSGKGCRVFISIHALREESDPTLFPKSKPAVDFNPRSPWGERHIPFLSCPLEQGNFNPRSPWGERPN